ncbi:YraN family protein [Candidatus Falkowbacteria bacterium]|nr:MAG: YraN family protein [Candidatus Falkowbacteria bacterium]
MNYRKKVGDYGEKIAANYLKRKGYLIIEKNVKVSFKEIDIIAKIKEIIVFIEVKTRTSNTLGSADEAISGKKINNLKKAINSYLAENKIKANNIRLDFIAINIDKYKKIANIKHFEDIF